MNKNLYFPRWMKILFCIALCIFGACSTRSPQKFSTNKFSINFPENFHIESNNAGTIFAASKSTDSVIIVDYEDIENKENRNFCNNLREDFFSKITSNRESSELYGFLIKRDGYDLENKEIFASLAFYCKKGIALHISYIYKSPSKYTDELFNKLIHEVNFK